MTEVSSATTIWTDYDGDQPYGDFTAVPGSPTSTMTEQRSFELGLATFDWAGGSPDGASLKFYHTDMIGTTRMMTDSTGIELPFSAVYTAFGERIAGSANRYGYAGAWGYQTDDTGNFPFQHVGARYYDPSIGRFLQRDPIGIIGGLNVYGYVTSNPVMSVDPTGLTREADGKRAQEAWLRMRKEFMKNFKENRERMVRNKRYYTIKDMRDLLERERELQRGVRAGITMMCASVGLAKKSIVAGAAAVGNFLQDLWSN